MNSRTTRATGLASGRGSRLFGKVACTVAVFGIASGFAAWIADFDPTDFIKTYVTVAAQRASKILGIFARLDMRDRKPQYLRHIPRVWGDLQRSLSHPALESLSAWYIANVPAIATI